MKNLFIIGAVLFSLVTKAQVKIVNLQASGLTCSMCSNSINKALRSLDFVDKVEANIKNSSFEVSFKLNSKVDFDKMKKKVVDAGYSVAGFSAVMHFENVGVVNDSNVTVGANVFHFLNVTNQTLNGDKTIRFLDKGFVPAKEYKKNSGLTKMDCYKTGLENGARVFHVTI